MTNVADYDVGRVIENIYEYLQKLNLTNIRIQTKYIW